MADLRKQGIDVSVSASSSESSLGNTTTATLAAGATFTGTAEQNSYNDVMIVVKADQNGTIYADFSVDGTNWDSTLTFYYDTARINPPHILVKGNRYFRVRFTNTSASTQTVFRLNCYYGSFQKLTSPINGTMSENYDALSVRPTDYFQEVALGKRQGRAAVAAWGINNDIDTGTDEIVAPWGGAFNPLTAIMSSAGTFTITYTPASDGSTATGARYLGVDYLDSDYALQTAIHVLGSTGSDVTSFTGFGINRVYVYTTGGAVSNVADITFTATSGGSVQAQVKAGDSVSQQMIYHIPLGHTLLIDDFTINATKASGSNPVVTARLWSFSRVTNAAYKYSTLTLDTSVTNNISSQPGLPYTFGGREVIYIIAGTDTNNTIVRARFSATLNRDQ